MAEETIKALDATDAIQVLEAVQQWINGLGILDDHLWLEYIENDNGFGYCIKSDGGAVTDEDICGNFTAEIPFMIYYCTNVVPDGAAALYKPLNDLSAWFKSNGVTGLEIGTRRTPSQIITTKSPTDLSGKDENGNTTFFSVFSLIYDEEAQQTWD